MELVLGADPLAKTYLLPQPCKDGHDGAPEGLPGLFAVLSVDALGTRGGPFVEGSGLFNREVVEVLDFESGPQNGFVKVKKQLPVKVNGHWTQVEGWIWVEHLSSCPEGTDKHDDTTGAVRQINVVDIPSDDDRFQEITALMTSNLCGKCHCGDGVAWQMQAKKMQLVTGHYMGTTGLVTGDKTTVFHGCKDAVKDSIVQNGFDCAFSSASAAFGPGLYLSPQACKSASYGQSCMLLCEVALGLPVNQHVVTAPDPNLNKQYVRDVLGKRSVIAFAGAPYRHDERIVYKSTQAKVVGVIYFQTRSPCHGV